jgi:SAM-dependent methyltransferase
MRAIHLQIPQARRVLDFGCGTGWVLGEALVEGRPRRFGIDLSLDVLYSTRRYGILPVLADGLHLPFAGEVFDVVIGHVSMPYMNTWQALHEIFRVLAPGGSFFFTYHSFYYWRKRLLESIRTRNWKDITFMGYVAVNGILNPLGLPQTQVWWKPSDFETVNTAPGVFRAARAAGFDMIQTEHRIPRIFFVATGRKPNPQGSVLPAPQWAVYCGLSKSQAPEPVPRTRAHSA